MKKFIKILPVIAALSFSSKLKAQQYFSDRVISEPTEITTSYGNSQESGYEAPGGNSYSNYSTGNDNSAVEEYNRQSVNIGDNNIAAVGPQTASMAAKSILDAPPDCPECTPDPGGDVPDVPFDRRLLILLIPGIIIIAAKVYNAAALKDENVVAVAFE